MGTSNWIAVVLLVLAGGSDEDLATQVAQRARELRPGPERLKWQKIPWVLELTEAVRMTKEERRPIFMWGSDDQPLERC